MSREHATAREVARRVLFRVLADGAFASAALDTALAESDLDPRDRGLVTEIVYGVLRTEPYLRRRVEAFGRPRGPLEGMWLPLLVATYELDFLDRIPARASIFEAVSAVKEALGEQPAGFANAVLRRVAESEGPGKRDAILSSTPSFLRKKLMRIFGEEDAVSLLLLEGSPSPVLRLRPGRTAPSWFAEEAPVDEDLVVAHHYRGGGDPRRRDEYARGDFVVQEKGAILLGLLADVPEDGEILDACAGRGMKTAILEERAGARGRVLATDLHEHKLSALREEFVRLDLASQTRIVDWTAPLPADLRERFVSVLLDAPCTGVGTLRRRPEIGRRLTAEDPARMAELQKTILANVALTVRPGGTLLYSTCSPLPEECEEVVATLGEEFSPEALRIPHEWKGARFGDSARLLPSRDGTDGYFVARFRKNKKET